MKKSQSSRNTGPQRQKLRVLYVLAFCLIIPVVALTPLLMYFGITNILDKALPGNDTQTGVIIYEPGAVLPEGQAGNMFQLPQTGDSLVLTSSPVVNVSIKAEGCKTDTTGYSVVHSWQRKGPQDSQFRTFANIGRDIGAVYDQNISVPTTESGLDSNYQYQVRYLVYRIDTKGILYYMNTFTSGIFQIDSNNHGFEGPVINLECP